MANFHDSVYALQLQSWFCWDESSLPTLPLINISRIVGEPKRKLINIHSIAKTRSLLADGLACLCVCVFWGSWVIVAHPSGFFRTAVFFHSAVNYKTHVTRPQTSPLPFHRVRPSPAFILSCVPFACCQQEEQSHPFSHVPYFWLLCSRHHDIVINKYINTRVNINTKCLWCPRRNHSVIVKR